MVVDETREELYSSCLLLLQNLKDEVLHQKFSNGGKLTKSN